MDAALESLALQKFVKNRLSPVALHAVANAEGAVQFVCALLSRLALPHHLFDVRLHLAAHGSLLFGALAHGVRHSVRVLRHSLLHLVDGFAQRVHDLTQSRLARLGKLLLALLQHLVRGQFHLRFHLGDAYVEVLLLSLKHLLVVVLFLLQGIAV